MQGVSLGLVCSTPAAMYKTSLAKGICSCLLAPLIRLLSEDVQNFDCYRTASYSSALAFLEKMKSAVTAANRTLPDVSVTQVPVSGSREMAIVQESVDAPMRTVHCSTKDIEERIDLRATPSLHIDTATVGNVPENTPKAFHSTPSAYLPLSFYSLSGCVSFFRSLTFFCSVPATVKEVSSDDYIEA